MSIAIPVLFGVTIIAFGILSTAPDQLGALINPETRVSMTQEQLEERSGFSQQYISKLERGRRNPTVITLFELAQALGVSHVELVRPDNESKG